MVDGTRDSHDTDPGATRTTGSARTDGVEAPDRIGRYRIVRVLGEGGMGVVYEAEQEEPRRRVALKVVRGERLVDEHHVRMLRREAETLGRLEHPNIGAIYESGRTEEGQPFFVMELVRGDTLDAYLARRPIPITDEELKHRLHLFRQICDAVHYAHQRGVIHRDLKPANIAVIEAPAQDPSTEPSGERQPLVKVLDFGLARITDDDAPVSTMVSRIGTIKGTLAYMSPEQARGDPRQIDLRSDVYALGVILYEMLVGKRPYELLPAALAEAIRVICEEPPRSLRKSWSGVRRIDPDVETIVLKALEKEADRRYTSVAALSEDIGRFLNLQPIFARPPSAAYQLRRFAQRHTGLVIGISTAVLALVLGLVATTAMYFRAEEARADADRAAFEARRSSYTANMRAAEIALRSKDFNLARARLDAADEELRGWEWGFLYNLLHDSLVDTTLGLAAPGRGNIVFSEDGSRVLITAVEQMGSLPRARSLDIATGELVEHALLQLDPGSGSRTLDIRRDGRQAILSRRSGEVLLIGSGDQAPAKLILLDGLVDALSFDRPEPGVLATHGAFSPDGSRVAIVLAQRDSSGMQRFERIDVFDTTNGRRAASRYGADVGGIWNLALSRDGERLAAQTPSHTYLWTAASERPIRLDPPEDAGRPGSNEIAFSHRGKLLAVPHASAVLVWDTEQRELEHRHETPSLAVGLTFAGDDGRLAVGLQDGTVLLLELLREPVEHDPFAMGPVDGWKTKRIQKFQAGSGLFRIATSPDGTRLAAWDQAGRLRVWPVGRVPGLRQIELPVTGVPPRDRWFPPPAVTTGDGGSTIVSVKLDGTLVTVDSRTGRIVGEALESSTDLARRMGTILSGDGSTAAVPEADGRLRVVETRTGRQLDTIEWRDEESSGLPTAALSHEGSRLAVRLHDGPVRISYRGGHSTDLPVRADLVRAEAAAAEGKSSPLLAVIEAGALRFGPDPDLLAVGQGGRVVLWDGKAGAFRDMETVEGSIGVQSIQLGPDGRLVVAVLYRSVSISAWEIAVWDTASGHRVHGMTPSGLGLSPSVVFSPDGSRLMVGWKDDRTASTLIVLDTSDFTPLLTHRFDRELHPVAFTPDGRDLLMAPTGATKGAPFVVELWTEEPER